LNLRRAAAIASLALAGAALDVWFWRLRVRAARLEIGERINYVKNPVGRIVPSLEVHYLRASAGELQIAGQANLPEGTLLDVQIYSGQTLVAVDYPVDVRRGAFQTRPMLQRGKPFTSGLYQVRIHATFGMRSQPPTVLQIVGPRGERLDGPLIHHADGTSEARLEFIQNFDLTQ